MRHFFLPPHPSMFSEPIQGVVDSAVKQGQLWRVKFQGSYWFARLYQANPSVTMEPGQSVKVIAIEGITLLVTPASFS
ncbi:NfeD family protein [Egbenema bharatensis]|uniref:NfeD family protein n=1 Tax=Egbenema bharatensis TaxID=3463334 RepID=UPI003A8599AC